MRVVTKQTVMDLFTGLKTLFNKALKQYENNDWQKTATEVPSTKSEEKYTWFGSWPKLREWIGDKVVNNISAHSYSVKNRPFEATIGVKKDELEDEDTGQYNMVVQGYGQTAAEFKGDLVNELKNDAFIKECYDGQYFYDSDHPAFDVNGDEITLSNKATVELSNATVAAADASLGLALDFFDKVYDEHGRKVSIKPTVLEVASQALVRTAKQLINNDKLADGSPNPYKGTEIEIILNSGLTNNKQWMVHATSGVVKPFLVQNRKAPQFVSQTSLENDDVFNKGEFKFGVEARGNGGYGFWQMSFGSTGQG